MNDAALKFDHFQFENHQKSNNPVTPVTRISHEDYKEMHTVAGAGRRQAWIPLWAWDESKFRQVISLRLWRYAHNYAGATGYQQIPEKYRDNFPALLHAVNERFEAATQRQFRHSAVQDYLHQKHLAAVRKAGGYAALTTAIIYRSLRLGELSPVIAESLGCSPAMVRQVIMRTRQCARDLGYETNERRHWSAGRPNLRRKRGHITVKLRPRRSAV